MSAKLQADAKTPEMKTIQDVGKERHAFVRLDPSGFYIRHPPAPHELDAFITPDDQLFQTIHMGAAVIDHEKYQLVIDGLVERPFAITLDELKHMPQTSITAFHECFGSPLKPPTDACLRIGNVRWTGVRLSYLLDLAGCRLIGRPQYVWSEGLDRGTFAGVEADRYQKDLPIDKALRPEVLVAYEMNGEALSKERGGPVRLVVPGYFGTNSTKWLCRLSVRGERAPGPYTTTFYNVRDPDGQTTRPVWRVEVNSMIVRPKPHEIVKSSDVVVEGWAWSDEGIKLVEVSGDGGESWRKAQIQDRFDYAWQRFTTTLNLPPGRRSIVARATSFPGRQQPLSGHRNHVHRIEVDVEEM
jgi:DMSO/TMAO reductase YedYZ molybdopterin-dependent catalytic subunit